MKTRRSLHRKLIYTCFVVLIYMLIRQIPLPWIVKGDDVLQESGILAFIGRTLGNETGSTSAFALGLMPWMTASIIIQLFHTSFRKEAKRNSAQRIRRLTLVLATGIAIYHGWKRIGDLEFQIPQSASLAFFKDLTLVIFVAGAICVSELAEQNKKHGIGAFSVLVLVNILESASKTAVAYIIIMIPSIGKLQNLILIPWGCGLIITVLLTILFECAEIRIPVNHVMIQNSLSEESYIAIKMNPSGTMPLMYVSTLFFLPYYLIQLLSVNNPDSSKYAAVLKGLDLESAQGICVFLLLLILLNVALSLVMVDPTQIADDMMKKGSYIENIRAGRETSQYIRKNVLFAAILSGILMAILSGIPLLVGAYSGVSSRLSMLPMTVMILTGIVLNVLEEIRTQKILEMYRPFL